MSNTKIKMTPEEILGALDQCTGTEFWHRHWLGAFTYTDGVQLMAELCAAYWLIDAIASYQNRQFPAVLAEEFQVWTLDVRPDHSATLSATDGNENVIAKQEIQFTDFPLEQIKFYLTDQVLLLPSEY